MECKNIEQLREILIKKLYKYQKSGGKDHIKLDIDKKILQQILFENKKIAIPDNLWKLLDLSGVSFNGVNVWGVDFTGSKGTVVIDPQEVDGKDLSYAKLAGVEITGLLDDVKLEGTDFTGSKGVIKLDPQTVYDKNLKNTKLADVEITGLLDDVKLEGTDFTGSKGALMCFEEAEVAIKLDANLTNVEIITYGKIEDKIEKAFQPQLKLE